MQASFYRTLIHPRWEEDLACLVTEVGEEMDRLRPEGAKTTRAPFPQVATCTYLDMPHEEADHFGLVHSKMVEVVRVPARALHKRSAIEMTPMERLSVLEGRTAVQNWD